MIVYPSRLPQNSQAFNLASANVYNPQNDIVLSVEYCISGNINTEAGLSFFLSSDMSFSGGVSGADLCYSGYYSGASRGIRTGVIGLGFDSTGVFGLSAGEYYSNSNPLSGSLSANYRDGFALADIKRNSIAVRGKRSDSYSLSVLGSYYNHVSSVNLVDSVFESRFLRFRLGNVAKTLYLDYKRNVDDMYEPIAVVDIDGYIDPNLSYKVGIGFTTPVSANNQQAVANFYFKRIQVEGYTGTYNMYTYNDLIDLSPIYLYYAGQTQTYTPPSLSAASIGDYVHSIEQVGRGAQIVSPYVTSLQNLGRPSLYAYGINFPRSEYSKLQSTNNNTSGTGWVKGITKKHISVLLRPETDANTSQNYKFIKIGNGVADVNNGHYITLSAISTTSAKVIISQGDGADYIKTLSGPISSAWTIVQIIDNGQDTSYYIDNTQVVTGKSRTNYGSNDIYIGNIGFGTLAGLYVNDDPSERSYVYDALDELRNTLV